MYISSKTKKIMIYFLMLFFICVPVIRLIFYDNPYLSDLYNSLLCVLYGVWGLSILQRVIDRRCRILFAILSGVMIFSELIKIAKYQQVMKATFEQRMLWYAMYVPILIMVLVSFYLSVCMLSAKTERTLSKWIWLSILSMLMSVFVLTNDVHQNVFSFPEGITMGDTIHQMEWGYWIVIGYIAMLSIGSFVNIFRKCNLPQTRKNIYVPIIILVIGMIYFALYVVGMHPKIFDKEIYNFLDIVCMLVIAIWESMIQLGLFPANSKHRQIFEKLGLMARIIEDSGEIKYSDDNIKSEWMGIDTHGDEMLTIDENTIMHKKTISGGTFIYFEDITSLNNIKNDLLEASELLASENYLIEEENKLKEENSRYRALNRVYDEIATEVNQQVVDIQRLLANKNISEEEFRENLARATFLNAYIKRLSNLILMGKQDGDISITELYMSVQESLTYLELLDIETFVVPVNKKDKISCDIILNAFKSYEHIIETFYESIKSIMVNISLEDRVINVRYSLVVDGDIDRLYEYGKVDVENDSVILSQAFAEGGVKK